MSTKVRNDRATGLSRVPTVLVCIVLLSVGAFLALRQGTAGLAAYAPLVLLLACPLLHIFTHRGRHDSKSATRGPRDESGNP